MQFGDQNTEGVGLYTYTPKPVWRESAFFESLGPNQLNYRFFDTLNFTFEQLSKQRALLRRQAAAVLQT